MWVGIVTNFEKIIFKRQFITLFKVNNYENHS
jgi:hypothetical protein